jgi:uncharacterized membrane protein YphA (DoxX/SURF4 family)
MSASKNRIDWGLLCLRLAVGAMAILHGLVPLRQAGAWNVSHMPQMGLALLSGLLEMICGTLMIAGIWMWPAAIGIFIFAGIPLVRAMSLRSLVYGHTQLLFQMIVTLASAICGPGKASLSKS